MRIREWRGRTLVLLAVIGLLLRAPVEFFVAGLTDDLRLKMILGRIVWLVWLVAVLGLVYLWLRGRPTERLP